MSNLKMQGEVILNTTNAEEGFTKVTQSAAKMSSAVGKSGKEAGDSIGKIGDGGEVASAKVDKATKSLIGSIQRTTAALDAGSKSGADYYKVLASQRGVSVDALKPYLAQLDAVNAKQAAATNALLLGSGGLKNVEMSAKATANALRGVPAQFTDIVTSLQGGQKPLTVFLQQGGQLKDMFGGAGNAAKALGGYVLGLVNPFTVGAVAVGSLGAAYYYGAQEAKEFQKNIITSGGAAGASVNQMIDLAARIDALGVGSKSLAGDALNALVGSGNVSSSVIEKASIAAIKSQQLLGTAVADTAKEFADLGKTPTASIEKLNDKYHFLTMGIYEQIKALEDQGKVSDAAKLAQNTYADATIAMSQKADAALTDTARGWNRIAIATKSAMDAIFDIGREDSSSQKITKLLADRDKLQSRRDGAAKNGEGAYYVGKIEAQLEANKSLIYQERLREDAIKARAKAEEQANIAVAAGIAWTKEGDKYLSKEAQTLREITKAREQGALAGLSSIVIEERIAAIKEKGASKSTASKSDLSKEIEARSRFVAAMEKEAETYGMTATQSKLYEASLLGIKGKQLDIVKSSLAKIESDKALTAASKRAAEGQRDIEKLYKSIADERKKSIASAESEADKNEELARTFGMTKTAIEEMQLARLEEQLAQRSNTAMTLDEIETLEKLIEAKKRSVAAISQVDTMASAKKQFDDLATESKKFTDGLYQGLSDALMRGFEAGKGFFKNFWDSLKNLFKTTVLKLAVQGVMQGVVGGAATGAASSFVSGALGGGSLLGLAGGLTIAGSSIAAIGSSVIAGVQAGFAGTSVAAAAGAYGAAGMGGVSAGLTVGSSIGAGASAITSALAAIPVWGWVALAAGAAAALGQGKDRVIVGTGVSGTLGTDNLTRDVSWTKDGGWFNSNTSGTWNYNLANSTAMAGGKAYTDTANLNSDKELLKNLNATYDALKTNTTAFANSLGLNADSIKARNDEIKFSFGKDAAETQANIEAAFAGISDNIAKDLLAPLSSLQKEGETTSQTLSRLSGDFTSINTTMAALGLAVYALGVDGIKAAEGLAEAFGGVDKLQAAASSYYDNFYSEAEKLALSTGVVSAAFKAANITMPETRDAFKTMVEEAQKIGDNKTVASLLNLSSAFAAVVPASNAAAIAIQAIADAASRAKAIAAEGYSLDTEMLQLQGNTQALRQRELALLDESNRARKQAIYDLQDKQAADAIAATEAQKAADAASQAASQAQQASEQIRSAWQSITNTLFDEVARIRGLTAGNSAQSLASAQAQFSIANVQALSGDQEAAKLLPKLSQTLLAIAEQQSPTLEALNRIRASTAGSLENTANSFSRFGATAPAQQATQSAPATYQAQAIYQPINLPQVSTAAANDTLVSSLIVEVREMKSTVEKLVSPAIETERNTRKMKDNIQRVTHDGEEMQSRVLA